MVPSCPVELLIPWLSVFSLVSSKCQPWSFALAWVFDFEIFVVVLNSSSQRQETEDSLSNLVLVIEILDKVGVWLYFIVRDRAETQHSFVWVIGTVHGVIWRLNKDHVQSSSHLVIGAIWIHILFIDLSSD